MIVLVYVLIAAATSAVAAYQYFLWQSQYWRRRKVPGPDSPPFFGNLRELSKLEEPSPLKLHEWTKKYGKVYGFKEGVRNVLVISDNEMVNEVFAKQFDNFYSRREPLIMQDLDNDPRVNLFEARGSRWKRLRALSSPSFSIGSLKKILPIVEDSAVKMVDLMAQKHGDGESFNIHRYFSEYTLDTICRLVMGQRESTLFENPRFEIFRAIFMVSFDRPIFYIAAGVPKITRVLRFISQMMNMSGPFRKLFTEIEATVGQRMEERKKFGPPAKPADFIDIFLESESEFDYKNRGKFSTLESVTKSLTVDEVICQAIVFLLAGFDTTSNALAYTAWMLSRHPEVLKRCQEEVDHVCRDSSISYEDCQNLRYLDAVCRETLRFYPLAAKVVNRTCMQDTTVGGIAIEKGTTVVGDTYAVHFSEELWGDDAQEFRPERWLESDKRAAAINFLSFGAGPRLCIGMRLAMVEEKIALAHLLRRFDILPDEQVSELKLIGCTTISPETVPVKIRTRT